MSETIFSRRPNRAIWKTAPLLALLLSAACAPGERTARAAEAAQAGTAPLDTLSVTARRLYSVPDTGFIMGILPDQSAVVIAGVNFGLLDLGSHEMTWLQESQHDGASNPFVLHGEYLDSMWSIIDAGGQPPPYSRTEIAYYARLSPDGERVASSEFWWDDYFGPLPASPVPTAGWTLKVVSTTGGPAQTLGPTRGSYWIAPYAWSPDGRSILVIDSEEGDTVERLGEFDVETGIYTRFIASDWMDFDAMNSTAGGCVCVGYSPDGEWIIYSRRIERESDERGIFALRRDGSEERLIFQRPGLLGPVDWSPDGRYLLYLARAEVPRNKNELYRQQFQDLAPVGQPALVQTDRFRTRHIGVSDDGGVFYGVNTGGESSVYSVRLGPDGRPQGPATLRPAGTLWDRAGGPITYSPDGKSLFYLRHVGDNLEERLTIESLESGSTVEFSLPTPQAIRPGPDRPRDVRWTADGDGLIVRVNPSGEPHALYHYDLATAALDTLLVYPDRGAGFAVTPDGKGVIFIKSGPGLGMPNGPDPDDYMFWCGRRFCADWTLTYVDILTGEEHVVQRDPDGRDLGRELGWPTISPDGESIAFVLAPFRQDGETRGEVWVTGISGGSARKVAEDQGLEWGALAWHPNGEAIYVRHKRRDGGPGGMISLIDVASGTVEPLGIGTNMAVGAFDVRPDGLELSYIGQPPSPERTEIWVLEGVFPPSDGGGQPGPSGRPN